MYIFGIKAEAKQPAKANLKTSRFPFFSQNSLKNLKNIRKTLKIYNIFWEICIFERIFWVADDAFVLQFLSPTDHKTKNRGDKINNKIFVEIFFCLFGEILSKFFFKFNENFQFCNLIFWYDRVSFMIKCQKHFADTLFLSLLIYNFFYFFFVSEFKETKEIWK